MRLINATADNGPVRLVASGSSATPPFRGSARLDVPAGATTIELRSPSTGELLFRDTATLPPDTAWTVIYFGGGEVPLQIAMLFDGAQPPNPPDPSIPINTGGAQPSVKPGWHPMLAITALVVGLVAVRRRRVAAFVVPLCLLTSACAGDGPGPGATSTEVRRHTSQTVTTDHAPGRASLARVPDPIHLTTPSIAVDAPVIALGAVSAGQLPTLLDGSTVAWLGGTSAPGEIGAAVLAGHVSWGGDQPAVFGRLGEIRRGARFSVTDAAGATRTFEVRSVSLWAKGAIPADLYAPTPEPTVILVTCTGIIDPATGFHAENLVILATASGPPS